MMQGSVIAFGLACAALVGGATWYATRSGDVQSASTGPATGGKPVPDVDFAAPVDHPQMPALPVSASGSVAPTPGDPRLAALRVSPDNDLIEFVSAVDGRVIREIDNDPASVSYRKPLRDYSYRGNSVVGMTAYQYLGDHVQVTRTRVSYKPDGSVDELQESTSYEYGQGPGERPRE